MKINKILNNLSEKFYKGGKFRGEYVEVFKNPTLDEIRSACEEDYNYIRFVADKYKEDLYVWNGDILHMDIVKVVKEFNYSELKNKYFACHGVLDGRNVHVSDEDLADMGSRECERVCLEIINGDFDWLDMYNFDIDVLRESAEYIKFVDGF